ncbi:MAG: DUF2807 domain-containing protein [Dehalococcoidales bacterium]|nr:DUF2807 domain-containing protein [Dehalococcoidales bacterium]
MKKMIFTLVLISLILSVPVLAGCVRVSLSEKAGPITTRYYNYTDFTGIDVGHAFEVTVTQSDNYSISITAGENAFEHIDVNKDGSTLVIGVDTWAINWFVSPKLTVTMPVLNQLELSGASKGSASGFRSSNDLSVHLSGASELDLDMETGDFFAEISGASKITGHLIASSSDFDLSGASYTGLTGSGGDARIEASGASRVELLDFAISNTEIDFSGASRATINVNGVLDVSLSGASSLEYSGSPSMGEMDISGASSINRITAP